MTILIIQAQNLMLEMWHYSVEEIVVLCLFIFGIGLCVFGLIYGVREIIKSFGSLKEFANVEN